VSIVRPPTELPGLEERLVSRFVWGMVADIGHPDLEHRIAILRKKAEQDHLELAIPDDVLSFIAHHVRSSVRELEGSIIKLLLYASLKHREVNLELAREALGDKLRLEADDATVKARSLPSIDKVQDIVARRWGVTPEGLRSKARIKSLTVPRQIAMYLAREMLQMQAAILENMAEGVVVTDDQGVIVQMNPAGERIWGYDRNEVVGQPVSVLSALAEPEATAVMDEVLETLQTTGAWRGAFKNRRKDGTVIICEVIINRVATQGGVLMVAVEQDVTERVRVEEQLQMQARVLESMAEAMMVVDETGTIVLTNPAQDALLGYDRGVCNLVRPGLMLYGVSPMPGFQERLSTVMTLKSRVTLVRTLPAGHGVSYGRQFVTRKPTRVATIGIGYGDGYPRHVSGMGAEVWLNGRRCPILGRVTMDQIMVDVTDAGDVREGDEVEMFGPNLPVGEIAEKAGTIVWEIFTGITPRVLRCYVGA